MSHLSPIHRGYVIVHRMVDSINHLCLSGFRFIRLTSKIMIKQINVSKLPVHASYSTIQTTAKFFGVWRPGIRPVINVMDIFITSRNRVRSRNRVNCPKRIAIYIISPKVGFRQFCRHQIDCRTTQAMPGQNHFIVLVQIDNIHDSIYSVAFFPPHDVMVEIPNDVICPIAINTMRAIPSKHILEKFIDIF